MIMAAEARGSGILKAIEQAKGNVCEAAKLLGIHNTYLDRLLRKLSLRELEPVVLRITNCDLWPCCSGSHVPAPALLNELPLLESGQVGRKSTLEVCLRASSFLCEPSNLHPSWLRVIEVR